MRHIYSIVALALVAFALADDDSPVTTTPVGQQTVAPAAPRAPSDSFVPGAAPSVLALPAPAREPAVGCRPTSKKSFGYPVEECVVVTTEAEPCFITLFHIQQKEGTNTRKQDIDNLPILLAGTPFTNSDLWVLDAKGFGFKLNDLGYDVWMINPRGTKYSQVCKGRSGGDNKFWKFGFSELAYDYKAAIDFILQKTKHPTLQFVGYSIANAMPFILTTKWPEYCDKFSSLYMISPAIFSKNNSVYNREFNDRFNGILADPAKFAIEAEVGRAWIMPTYREIKEGLGFDCDPPSQHACIDSNSRLWGGTNDAIDPRRFEQWMFHGFNGMSARCLATTFQWAQNGNFADLDFGCPLRNKKKYGQTSPPKFSMKQCPTLKVTVSSWSGDNYVDKKAISQLAQDMACDEEIAVTSKDDWGHGTFIFNKNVERDIYPTIFKELSLDQAEYIQRIKDPSKVQKHVPVATEEERRKEFGASDRK